MNIAIIDDDYEDCSTIEHFVKTYFENGYQDLTCRTFSYHKEQDFLDALKENYFDVIFVDYYLEQYTGLELAQAVRKVDEAVILIMITRSSDFAIEAYKVKASGYLLKPLVYKDFAEIMSLLDYEKARENQCVEIANYYETERIRIKEIVMCEADGHYVRLTLWNKQIKKYRSSFSDFLETLKPFKEFLHCYRGCVINMSYIKTVDDRVFIMNNGEFIPIRIKQREKVLQCYYDYLFQRNREHRQYGAIGNHPV